MKKTRIRHKLLEKLAERTGISKAVLSDYIAGRKKPSADKIFYLEDMTGIPARIWVQGTPDQKRSAVNAAMMRG
jgi:transcriptional regulator with XRE-family HTH domain